MKQLLKEYNATKRNTEAWFAIIKERLAVVDEEKRLRKVQHKLYIVNPTVEEVQLLEEHEAVKGMLSDINYIISWLRRGGQPNRKRGIERQEAYKRESATDPYWIQLEEDDSGSIDTIEELFEDHTERLENESIKEGLVKEITKNFSAKQMEILKLKADGFTHGEIADALHIPKGTIDVTMKRIKEKVKAEGWFML